MAAELTANSRDDASIPPDLLDLIEVLIRCFMADGAYDHRSVYDQISAVGTEAVVLVLPPRRSIENGFFRYKSVFGGGLQARHSKAQSREAAIGCPILNRMAELGTTKSYFVVS